MKKFKAIIFLALGMILFVGNINSTVAQEKSKKELKREQKAAKKEARKRQEKLDFDLSKQAIEERQWVLEARTIQNRRGSSLPVDSSTNFVSMDGDDVYIQLAFAGSSNPGQNGLGGITLKGHPTNEEISYDKHGNLYYNLTVIGAAVTADITISMGASGRYADAVVKSMFHNSSIRFNGELFPKKESTYFKSGNDI